MDNKTLDVTAEGLEGIEYAIKLIAHNKYSTRMATHYQIKKLPAANKQLVDTLIFYWHEDINHGSIKLPFNLKSEAMISFITQWLDSVEYPSQPDHDGSNGQGWRIFNEGWGHVDNSHYAFLAVQPTWAMYGK